MSYLSDIVDYLEDQSLGVAGTNLFEGYLPNDPDTAMAVIVTGGNRPEFELPTLRFPTFQVFIRTTDFALGQERLEAVRDRLHSKANTTIVPGGEYFYYIDALAEGGHVGQDEVGRFLFSINFRAMVRNV